MLARQFTIYFLFLCLLGTLSPKSFADLTIFDSRRPVSMSNGEVTYRDFYINGGIEEGLKKNMILNVERRLTLYDSYKNKTPSELMVEVGRVKIIHVQKGLSVARHYADFSRKVRPILENDYIMVGDKVDLGSALMESQLKKNKKSAAKSASSKKQPEQAQKESQGKSFAIDFASQSPKSEKQEPLPVKSLQ